MGAAQRYGDGAPGRESPQVRSISGVGLCKRKASAEARWTERRPSPSIIKSSCRFATRFSPVNAPSAPPSSPEKELSKAYSVSRITARRALDELAQHHFVARKRRVGTTVIFRPPAKPFEANIDQAMDSLLEFGRVTKVRVLSIGTEVAAPSVAEAMHIEPGERVVR